MNILRGGRAPFLFFFILIAGFISGCAKSIPPAGGPVDKDPPQVLSTTPAPGQTNVSRTTTCEFVFSEKVNSEDAERAVFVFPRQAIEPKVNVKGTRLIIDFKDSLQEHRTYVVTMGTDLRDLRDNRLAQSYTLAFSTGETIDSGLIKGQIFDEDRGVAGISVGLFSRDDLLGDKQVDSLSPDFITQTGENGDYQFSFLAPGSYALAAFDDRNKNRLIDPDQERLGIPFALPELTAKKRRAAGFDMRLFSRDTTSLYIRSVTVTPDNLIKLRLSKPIKEAAERDLIEAITIQGVKDSSLTGRATAASPLTDYPAADFLLVVEGLLPEQEYDLNIDLANYPEFASSKQSNVSYRFRFSEKPDLTRPIIISQDPAKNALNVSPETMLLFQFSEPVSIDSEMKPIRLSTVPEETVAVPVTREKLFSVTAVPEKPLLHGSQYTLLLNGRAVRDRAGNVLADSMLSSVFTIIGEDTLGVLSGSVDRGPYNPETPVRVTVKETQSGRTKEVTVASGISEFRVQLLPGLYLVRAYIDENNNGIYDHGQLRPFILAEPFIVGVDTFRVRTRFESTGVEVNFK